MLKDYFDKLYRGDQKSFFDEIGAALQAGDKRFVVTANPETLMIGESNPDFDTVLKKSDVTIVPDGIGVVKGAEMLGMEMHGRVTGVELAAHLIALCHEGKKKLFLYGAKQEVLTALTEKISREYPDCVLCGAENGYGGRDDEVFPEIVKAEPDVVLVALGIPRQELLIDRYYDSFEKGIFVGVGGSFDVLSGTKRRAPKIFVKLNLEWLWRILREPARLGRFYRSNVKYFSRIRHLKKES